MTVLFTSRQRTYGNCRHGQIQRISCRHFHRLLKRVSTIGIGRSAHASLDRHINRLAMSVFSDSPLVLGVCCSVHRAYPTEISFLLSDQSEHFSVDFDEDPISVHVGPTYIITSVAEDDELFVRCSSIP